MDLFDDGAAEALPIVDAQITLWRHVDIGDDRLTLDRLITETPWREERVTVWGKSHFQPRLVAWYGDLGTPYSYSGSKLLAVPWSSLLMELKSKVESLTNHKFNSVLLNYYRNNSDSMGFHSDDEPELGDQPVIASLSLGEERRFVLKHKWLKEIEDVVISLPSSSLLLMSGDTQNNWKHGIPKEARHCGPRVNLTFRNIATSETRD